MVRRGTRAGEQISSESIALYIGYMFEAGYAPSTINSSVSALSFVFKWEGKSDPADCFYVRSLQRSLGRFRLPDSRQAITSAELATLCERLANHPEARMLACLFSLAFYGLCRMGELIGSGPHVLKMENVAMSEDGIRLTLETFKHSKRSATLLVTEKGIGSACPVRNMEAYLQSRPAVTSSQSFFVTRTGKSVGLTLVNSIVKGLGDGLTPPKVLGGHSFRIGGTGWAVSLGKSTEEIKRMGRWESDAFRRYLRGEVVH